MRKIYFIITNQNHHWQNVLPLIQELQSRGERPVLISFCELRRQRTPLEACREAGIPVICPVPVIPGAKPSTGTVSLGKVGSGKREVLYTLMFYGLILPRLALLFRRGDTVVHFNDFAFPGNYLTPWLRKKGVRQILLQEGIRFPLPQETEDYKYGTRGADLICCWGEDAAQHFRKIAAANTAVSITGSPRYQAIRNRVHEHDTQACIGIFTNSIDDQGFCSNKEKIRLFENLVARLSDGLRVRKVKLLVKPHPREDREQYRKVLEKMDIDWEFGNADIFECIHQVQGGIVFASSVGLELLFLGKKLAQAEMPGFGFVFDYVHEQMALPVHTATPGVEILDYLLGMEKPEAKHYLSKHLNSELDSQVLICDKIQAL
ncbi:MAG: hypothetical protein EOP49_03275 [Sphingobacteriales bacterium]|nr:MAG: hypothetical protein EOP49_03275 [Sphingobacteriales bacterium]